MKGVREGEKKKKKAEAFNRRIVIYKEENKDSTKVDLLLHYSQLTSHLLTSPVLEFHITSVRRKLKNFIWSDPLPTTF